MLDSVFISILDLTKVSSLVILAVIVARLLLKRAPKVISYALWAVVLLRLLVPVEIQSPVSMLPELKPTTQSYALEDEPISFVGAGTAAYQAVGDVLNGGIDMQQVPTSRVDDQGNVEYVSADIGDVFLLFGAYVWGAGVIGLAAYSLISILKLRRKLREAVRLEDGVYLAEGIDSPFVMGMLPPKIYLPQGLTEGEHTYILAHERHHIRRLDPLWKALGFVALCIHWFNPLVWLAFSLACRDMEMSCDEAVLKNMGAQIRGDYAASLLKIATGRKAIVGGPLAFGEGDPKGRIKNLARWKKPVIWLSILAVIICIVLAVCLLTSPVPNKHSRGSYIFGKLEALEGNWLQLNCASGETMEFTLAADYTIPEGIQVGDHVMVRLDYRNETEDLVINRVALTGESLPALPDQAIEDVIKRMNGEIKKGQFAAVSFVELSRGRTGIFSVDNGETKVEMVEVLGMALYQVYTNRNGKLHEVSGSHIPVSLKFRVTDDGQYILSEYWQPRDGSYYAEDLRDKFGYVPNTQKYIEQQRAECLEKAEAYFKIGQPARPMETIPPTTKPATTPTTEPAPTEPAPTEPAPTEPVSVQPDMPEVGTESRQLSAEEIQVFTDFFYPGSDLTIWYNVTTWYNYALLSRYSSPADLHVLWFFYSAPVEELTAEDHAFYGEAPGFLHKYSISVMNEKLMLCFGITMDEVNGVGMEELVYNEAGQCYYHDHGDMKFAQPKFFDGYVHPDGTVQLYYNGFHNYYDLWEDTPTVVTLKYVGENGVNHWHILSNVKAE